MAIKKQEFYEGAALHLLARTGQITCIRYDPPLFFVNNTLLLHLKYSTKKRSPWGFTFVPDEQLLMQTRNLDFKVVLGLVCGSDGIATVPYDSFLAIAPPRASSVHISCYRQHGEHYEINGPDGTLERKVAPSAWLRVLEHAST